MKKLTQITKLEELLNFDLVTVPLLLLLLLLVLFIIFSQSGITVYLARHLLHVIKYELVVYEAIIIIIIIIDHL